jgi:hypothetical protein
VSGLAAHQKWSVVELPTSVNDIGISSQKARCTRIALSLHEASTMFV